MPLCSKNVLTLFSMMSPSVAPRVATPISTFLFTTGAPVVTGVVELAAVVPARAVGGGVVEVAGCGAAAGAWRQACSTGIAAAKQIPTTNRRRVTVAMATLPALSVERQATSRQKRTARRAPRAQQVVEPWRQPGRQK